MTDFKDREKAFEAKYAHDEQLKFRIMARRNKYLGLWAAGLMEIGGEKAEQYAKEVIRADFEEAGEEDVYRKVKGDLDAAGIDISEHRVRREMLELLEKAQSEIEASESE